MLQHTCERCLPGVNLPTLQITAQINAQKNTEAAWQIRPQIGVFFFPCRSRVVGDLLLRAGGGQLKVNGGRVQRFTLRFEAAHHN